MHDFYLRFTLFHSRYLEHTHEEEVVTELLLQKYFRDDELIQHRQPIMKRLSSETLLLWLKYIIPAQRTSENLEILSGLKANAPKLFFEQVMETIKGEMEQAGYEELKGLLAK